MILSTIFLENTTQRMNKSVVILLSTYNGEKYLEEQLASIFSQTYWQNCTLFVRDDGSKDGTVAILKKYEQEGKLRLECGENVGFVRSFFWLINNAPEADYYSFADQDDVWNADKIERAVKMLENAASEAPQKPLLYFANLDIYDSEMHFVRHNDFISSMPSFETLCTQSLLTGMTFIFNKQLLNLIRTVNPLNVDGHDYITAMIASGCGKLVMDSEPVAKYRRHNSNTSPLNVSFFKMFMWRFKRFFIKGNNKISSQFYEYREKFEPLLSEDKRYFVHLLTKDKTLHFRNLRLCFYPKRFRKSSIFEEVALRLMFLTGRL